MKKQSFYLLLNPFERTAGYAALVWGFIGIIIATLLSYLTGWHYHGLLHFGWAPNPAWWCFAVEHLVVWLIPAILFYIGGLLVSRSRIRLVDVLGTVAFAQIPFIIMNLFSALPAIHGTIKPEQLIHTGINHATHVSERNMAFVTFYDILRLDAGVDVLRITSILQPERLPFGDSLRRRHYRRRSDMPNADRDVLLSS